MPTLLVNSKMDSMLAARIEASVAGRRSGSVRSRASKRLVSVLRLGLVAGIVVLAATVYWSRRARQLEFDRQRTSLLNEWRRYSEGLSNSEREFSSRIAGLLAGATGDYGGDLVGPELRGGEFSNNLSKRSLYVRGPLASFQTSLGLRKSASESGRDAFLLCALDPPPSGSERAYLPKARLALEGGRAAHQLSPHFYRLQDVEAGVPYLSAGWGEQVRAAKEPSVLMRLEREFKRAPLSAAKEAMAAERLLAVLDEPNDSGGVTEMDGEHAHSVRVLMWDLAANKLLLRFRTKVDPAWITPNRRSQYARELDSCKLAVAARDYVNEIRRP